MVSRDFNSSWNKYESLDRAMELFKQVTLNQSGNTELN